MPHSMLTRRAFLSASATLAGAGLSTACDSFGRRTGAAVTDTLNRQIPAWMTDLRVPGLGVAVVRDGELAWQAYYGVADASAGAPVDADTVFEAASMSKPVFAAAVFRLHEQGVLDVDAPLVRYDTTTVGPVGRWRDQITARHILSHTSGLPAWRSSDRPLAAETRPGSRWRYSGEGYFWLQSVVTALLGHVDPTTCGTYEGDLSVCGSDFDDVVRPLVLRPAGMPRSGYLWTPEIGVHAAIPHDANGGTLSKRQATSADVSRYAAAGGLQCPVLDYVAFLIWLLTAGPNRLSAATIDDIERPLIPVSETPFRSSWAAGWQILHTDLGDLIAHGGDNEGFHCYAAASRMLRSGFVVMTNGDGGAALLSRLVSPGIVSALIADPLT